VSRAKKRTRLMFHGVIGLGGEASSFTPAARKKPPVFKPRHDAFAWPSSQHMEPTK
jgi:hypothetical protein